jgi:hypothetical protein
VAKKYSIRLSSVQIKPKLFVYICNTIHVCADILQISVSTGGCKTSSFGGEFSFSSAARGVSDQGGWVSMDASLHGGSNAMHHRLNMELDLLGLLCTAVLIG